MGLILKTEMAEGEALLCSGDEVSAPFSHWFFPLPKTSGQNSRTDLDMAVATREGAAAIVLF
jgi:hypothetical protein